MGLLCIWKKFGTIIKESTFFTERMPSKLLLITHLDEHQPLLRQQERLLFYKSTRLPSLAVLLGEIIIEMNRIYIKYIDEAILAYLDPSEVV